MLRYFELSFLPAFTMLAHGITRIIAWCTTGGLIFYSNQSIICSLLLLIIICALPRNLEVFVMFLKQNR